jgi:hypothetical protein
MSKNNPDGRKTTKSNKAGSIEELPKKVIIGQSQFFTNVRTKNRFGSVFCRANIDALQ